MNYMTAIEAAKKWGVSQRQVQRLAEANKIPGTRKHGNAFLIPADAVKPADARIKSGNYIKKKAALNLPDSLSKAFRSFLVNPELMFQFFDMFPFPVEIFTPDGLSVYLNRAWMELFGITDASLVVGKFNVRNDPESEKLTGREFIDRMLEGDSFRLSDISAPVDDHVERGVAEEKVYDAAFIDVHSIPVWDGDNFKYAICMLLIRQTYKGKAEIAKAVNYIHEHLTEEFDLDKTAKAATLSRRHFQRMFKEVMDVAPFDYYKNKKIEKLQEKLLDPDLSVTEAFAACGADYNTTWLNAFKEATKLTPTEYRKQN